MTHKHRLTELVIDCYHRLENHGGVDHVLAAIRSKFWIIRGQQEVKHFKQRYQKCKREGAKVGHQLLSELLIERMTPMEPVFYHASVDYFGPITVWLTRNTTAEVWCPIHLYDHPIRPSRSCGTPIHTRFSTGPLQNDGEAWATLFHLQRQWYELCWSRVRAEVHGEEVE